jgi:hypothetical protein
MPLSGKAFDSLAVEEAIQSLGFPDSLSDAVCEVVVDEYGNCVDRSLLPSALDRAGVSAVDALRVFTALGKVCIALLCSRRVSI